MYLFPLLVGVDVMQLSHPRECRMCSTQFADILLEVFCDSLIPRHNDTRLLVLSTYLVLQVTTATGRPGNKRAAECVPSILYRRAEFA